MFLVPSACFDFVSIGIDSLADICKQTWFDLVQVLPRG